MNPQFMNAGKMQSMTGARGYQTYKISEAKNLPTTGNANTTFIPKFIPVDREQAYQTVKYGEPGFLSNNNVRSVFLGNLFTRKRSNN